MELVIDAGLDGALRSGIGITNCVGDDFRIDNRAYDQGEIISQGLGKGRIFPKGLSQGLLEGGLLKILGIVIGKEALFGEVERIGVRGIVANVLVGQGSYGGSGGGQGEVTLGGA